MIIGRMGPGQNGAGLANGFEQAGHEVYRVAVDNQPATPERSGKFDFHIHTYFRDAAHYYRCDRQEEYVDLRDLYRQTDFDPDFILLVQNGLIWKIQGMSVYYYVTTALWDHFPVGVNPKRVTGMFGSYYGFQEQYRSNFPVEVKGFEFNSFVPVGVDLDQFPARDPDREYEFDIGFMGSYSRGLYKGTFLKEHVYDLRNDFVTYLKDKMGGAVYPPCYTKAGYVDFHHRCRMILNVPAVTGGVNQRQYEAPASGTVLVQYEYPGIKELGFEDGENCILFTTKTELEEKTELILDEEESFESIRQEGIKFAQQNTWRHRAERMVEVIGGL